MQLNEYKNKYEIKVRDIEKMRDDAKRREKAAEDRINISNCKNFYLFLMVTIESNKQLND
jgi:hypothetical protein